jgi:hypothetical protein
MYVRANTRRVAHTMRVRRVAYVMTFRCIKRVMHQRDFVVLRHVVDTGTRLCMCASSRMRDMRIHVTRVHFRRCALLRANDARTQTINRCA